jgi:hypothetical protein
MPLLSGELVRTSSEGQAVVQLIDGSGIRLARSTWIKLAPRWSDSGDRSVHVEVERGQIEAVVSKATQQSSFDVSNRVAVASVRGTVLRFANEPAAAARLETLEGAVRLSSASAAAAVEVAAGQGARVSASGTVGPARPLPAPPRVVSPLWGELLAPAVLTWAAGPDATTYLVELARDADFLRAATEYGATGSSLALPARPASGKWFWRVTACSAEGFFGAPSPVYSFTVRP